VGDQRAKPAGSTTRERLRSVGAASVRSVFKFGGSQQLLDGLRAGDAEILEHIYSAYVNEVEAIIKGRLARGPGRGWGGEMEDLVHEVFARAFSSNARRSFNGVGEYGAYLAAIARNLVATWAHRRLREPTIRDLDGELQIPAPEQESEPPWADVETMAVVQRYLSLLPAELQAVHEQRYVKCLPQEVVCRVLGLSRQQLRTQEKRLRKGLKRELKRAKLRGPSGTTPRNVPAEIDDQPGPLRATGAGRRRA
jgi:RNA polymerase sigma factor (sigma-70 family)